MKSLLFSNFVVTLKSVFKKLVLKGKKMASVSFLKGWFEFPGVFLIISYLEFMPNQYGNWDVFRVFNLKLSYCARLNVWVHLWVCHVDSYILSIL